MNDNPSTYSNRAENGLSAEEMMNALSKIQTIQNVVFPKDIPWQDLAQGLLAKLAVEGGIADLVDGRAIVRGDCRAEWGRLCRAVSLVGAEVYQLGILQERKRAWQDTWRGFPLAVDHGTSEPVKP